MRDLMETPKEAAMELLIVVPSSYNLEVSRL